MRSLKDEEFSLPFISAYKYLLEKHIKQLRKNSSASRHSFRLDHPGSELLWQGCLNGNLSLEVIAPVAAPGKFWSLLHSAELCMKGGQPGSSCKLKPFP